MKWEYSTLKFQATGFMVGGVVDGQKLNDELNRLGRQGWELVSIFDTNMLKGETRDVFAVLKRTLDP